MPYTIKGGFSTKKPEEAVAKLKKAGVELFSNISTEKLTTKKTSKEKTVKSEVKAEKKEKPVVDEFIKVKDKLKAMNRKEQEAQLKKLGVEKKEYSKLKENGLINLIIKKMEEKKNAESNDKTK